MSERQRELYDIIIELPEELFNKAFDYLEYLKFLAAMDDGPEDLKIKSKEDLINKLNKGLDDIKNGRVVSVDEAFNEAEKLLAE